MPLTPAESAPVTLAAAAASSAAPLTILPASVPGLSRSPLPRSRPAAVRNAAPVATPAPATAVASAATPGADPEAEALLQELVTRLGSSAPAVSEIDPTTLPAGTRLVQLGAYDSADEARSAWNGLASRFPAYLEGRGRIVEAASAGGRTFYRLRAAGFQDEPEARRFCAVFLGENVDCIPVLVR